MSPFFACCSTQLPPFAYAQPVLTGAGSRRAACRRAAAWRFAQRSVWCARPFQQNIYTIGEEQAGGGQKAERRSPLCAAPAGNVPSVPQTIDSALRRPPSLPTPTRHGAATAATMRCRRLAFSAAGFRFIRNGQCEMRVMAPPAQRLREPDVLTQEGNRFQTV